MLPTRMGWLGARDEESRAHLQARLISLSRLMFWSFLVLLGGMVALYYQYPHIEPARNNEIYAFGSVGVVILAIIWRGVLLRFELKVHWLYTIDLFYAFATGSVFGAAAYLASELKSAQFANMLWCCFMVFLRTIVVPSTGKRTAITGALTFAPILAAAIALALTVPQEVPPLAYVSGDLLISAVVVLLATIGSRMIYGLQQKVSAAMRLGQYTLDQKIGEGGYGAVYRAHHALLRRPTAIKLILPEKIGADTLDRFEREVHYMSQLTHWNTVAIYDYGRNLDGVFYYAMEYLDGINLENLVIEHGRQPADRVISIMVQVCAALKEAHRHGIIHRDIKPANIILCERGDVPDVAKVVDFGLVKELTAEDGMSKGAMILGTPSYVAPEALTDPALVGPASDLYALGCVGYFLLTGRRVFEGKTSVDVCIKHVNATPTPPSSHPGVKVPKQLEDVILKCLAKQPEQRPANAAALAEMLRAIPPSSDWSEDQALAWWAEFHRESRKTIATADTKTITVDINDRDSGPTPFPIMERPRGGSGDVRPEAPASE